MALGIKCPTCDSLTFDDVCPQCAFSSALAGLSAGESDALQNDSSPQAPDGFELLEKLGRGATAVVWLAREHRLDRLIALKFITANADRQTTQRLIREGQAAARLRHPNIVAVHAMSTTEAQAWLTMDFMAGGDLRQRLQLGLPAPRDGARWVQKLANALGHAHANSILHRDIKPSNVLLDAAGEPHLADFGLAAPLEGGGDLTLPGQVAGTAAYLAPELLAGADHASPLSDLYGLGALLYETLTGRPPFVGESAAAIFAQLAASDPPSPRLLRPEIPRDLETICLKCLEKTTDRRYASAGALEGDLGRFLRGEPITARPVSVAEKSVRWCRRHPATATFATLAAALLLCLAIGGPLIALRLARAKAQAAAEAASSKAVSDFLQNDLLAQAAPENEPDRDLKLRTVLDRAAKNIDGRFSDQPVVEADLRETLAKTYFSLGENESARRQWEQARALRQRWLGAENPKTLEAAAGLFDVLRALGKYSESETLAREVTDAMRRVLGPEHRDTISALNNLALVYRAQGKLALAEELYVQLAPVHRRIYGPENRETLTVSSNLATVYRQQGKNADAERLNREVFEIRRRVFGLDDPHTLISMQNLALCYYNLGRMDEAEAFGAQVLEIRRRVLGPDHPDTLTIMVALALFNHEDGKLAEAEAIDLDIMAIQKRKLGPNHPSTLITMNNLARLYHDEGKFAESEALSAATLEARRRVLGPKHPYTLQSMGQLAASYRDAERLADAGRLATEMMEGCESTLGPTHPLTVQAWIARGSTYLREGNFTEAEPLLRRAVAGYSKVTTVAWRTAVVQSQFGEVLLSLKRHDEAEPLLLASYEALKKNFARIPPATRKEIVATARHIAQLYGEWNQPEKSATWNKIIAELSTASDVEPPTRAQAVTSKGPPTL